MFLNFFNSKWVYFYTFLKFQPFLFNLISWLRLILKDWVNFYTLDVHTIDIFIKKNFLKKVLFFLKNHTNLQLSSLSEIVCIDYPGKSERFELNYILLSTRYSFRLRVRFFTKILEPVESVTALYSGANWLEREVWDLFGVFFFEHKDLRRILTDYGFEGHPLRKDFPLTGFLELLYDDSKKKLVYEPVSLAQEFRNYEFTNPWLLGKF